MPTDPLTGSRYPASSAAPNVNQDIQNAVMDLADNTIPRFASIAARDTAYSNWVASGGTMAAGLHCTVAGLLHRYDGSTWRWEDRGSGTVTTNGSGFASITHGVGATPNGVILTPGKQATDLLDRVLTLSVSAKTASTFDLYAHRSDTSAALPNNPVQFSWIAFV